jgi:hypothetical protein
MIDQTQLTEALAYHADSLDDAFVIYPAESQPIFEAARWARDFPTDAHVTAILRFSDNHNITENGKPINGPTARLWLEAVSMIGDNQITHGYGESSDCLCGRNFATVRGLREHLTKSRQAPAPVRP